MTWETIIFYVLLAVTWYIRTTTAYLRPFLAKKQYTYVEKVSNTIIRSISGLLGQEEISTRTPTATTRLQASTSDDMALKQSNSAKKLSELVSFNVMGYLRNSGWGTDSEALRQKYVDNIHAAELGDPDLMLSPASMANYRKNLDSNYYNNDNNDNNDNYNDDDSDDNENNDNDNDGKIVYDGNLVRSIRFTLESAVESVVTMLPFNEGSDGFVNYATAMAIQYINESEEVRHARATTSATITNDNEDDSDYSFEIVAIEDIGSVDDNIPTKNSVSDKRDGGSSGESLGTPVVIPGYMDFDPKLAAASTMRKKYLPLSSLTSLSDKGGLIAEAFFDFSTKRQ